MINRNPKKASKSLLIILFFSLAYAINYYFDLRGIFAFLVIMALLWLNSVIIKKYINK